APAAAMKPGSGHTTKLNNGKSNTSSVAHLGLGDSRTNLAASTPTACQRLR
ncbi:hypothetical protein KR059_002185, partial [Drosophila kikkawai]